MERIKTGIGSGGTVTQQQFCRSSYQDDRVGGRPNSPASALPGMADQQSSPGVDNVSTVSAMLQCVKRAARRDTCGCILHASVGSSVGNGQGKQQK